MIVIATHNGKEPLSTLLSTMEVYGTCGQKVLICDTCSTQPSFLEFLQLLKEKNPYPFELEITRTPTAGYEAGAWIHAYKTHPKEKEFLFLQDSMRVSSTDYVEAFRKVLGGKEGVVPWVPFYPCMCNMFLRHMLIISKVVGRGPFPEYGIFGNIFYTTREPMEIIEKAGFLEFIPEDKAGAECMERLWPTYFMHTQQLMIPLFKDGWGNPTFHNGTSKHLQKIFGKTRA